MHLSSTAISSVASYTKMTDTPATTPVTPVTPLNNSNGKKFEGDGISYKGKLIGMEDLSIDRDEKVCLDAMFKLKAVVRARGDHKQKVQLNLTMSAVKIIDDTTKEQIASHEIERISFVVVDPRDNRAFGYIFNTADNRHQFWAIKTERSAAPTVISLKELFDVAFEQFANAEKAKLDAKKTTTTTTATTPPPESPPTQLVTTQESSSSSGILDAPLSTPTSAPVVPTTTPSLLDDVFGIDNPISTTTQTTTSIIGDLWDTNAPSVPVIQPKPKIVDPLEDLFANLSTTELPPAPTNTVVNFLPNSSSQPINIYTNNVPSPTVETNPFSATPLIPQQQPFIPRIAPPPPQQQQQQDLLVPRSLSPVPPPSVTNPFSGFDLLVDLSSGTTTTRPTKESFFSAGPPPKTIQQLQMEKQS